MPPKLNADQEEAVELRDLMMEHAYQHGWRPTDKTGVNKAFAFTQLIRTWGPGEDETETLQAFYGVGADATDRFLYQGDADDPAHTVEIDVIREILENPTELEAATPLAEEVVSDEPELTDMAGWDEHGAVDEVDDDAVPPTDAAHQETVPPTSTDDTSAAHQELEEAKSAARSALAEMNDELAVPPTEDEQSSAAHEMEQAQYAKKMHDSAARSPLTGDPVSNQGDTYREVYDKNRPARGMLSEYSSDTIVKMVTGKELGWHNSYAGRIERAVVSSKEEAKRWPTSITPADEDLPDGDDHRILHFLERNGGFRSVAVARIKEVK